VVAEAKRYKITEAAEAVKRDKLAAAKTKAEAEVEAATAKKRGDRLLRENEFDAAIEAYKEALKWMPDDQGLKADHRNAVVRRKSRAVAEQAEQAKQDRLRQKKLDKESREVVRLQRAEELKRVKRGREEAARAEQDARKQRMAERASGAMNGGYRKGKYSKKKKKKN